MSKVILNVDQCRGDIQVSINWIDDDGYGHGYRIMGQKYDGTSKTLKKVELTKRDAEEIRSYLDRIKP